MKRGKYEAPRAPKRHSSKKALAVMLSLVLVIGCVTGGTLAWLTAGSETVTNTFTESGINITLNETKPENKTAPMVPGWKIDKNPTVTVDEDSEDCWLFVKITESTNPDLDAYISYAIAPGWITVQSDDANGVTVIGRKVYKGEGKDGFAILGAGTYTDPMGDNDNFTITWGENQVCVKPSVTEQMMEDIRTNKPTLSFQAYAVQLFKTNSDGNKDTITDEFTAVEAWARIPTVTSATP